MDKMFHVNVSHRESTARRSAPIRAVTATPISTRRGGFRLCPISLWLASPLRRNTLIGMVRARPRRCSSLRRARAISNQASDTMARKRKFKSDKTRIRSFMRRLAEYGVDDIDKFRELVSEASTKRKRSYEKLAVDDDDDFFAGVASELDTISRLTDELSIVALYRVVEVVTAQMVIHDLGSAVRADKMYQIAEVKRALKTHKNLELKTVPYYGAMDQLRRLNNDIKHTDGRDLSKLDKKYDRFRRTVPLYILRLAERMKLRYR